MSFVRASSYFDPFGQRIKFACKFKKKKKNINFKLIDLERRFRKENKDIQIV